MTRRDECIDDYRRVGAGIPYPGRERYLRSHSSTIVCAIVRDSSVVGAESVVRAGACVKQRDRCPGRSIFDGFPRESRRYANRRTDDSGLGGS
jgi:hypothetical protein